MARLKRNTADHYTLKARKEGYPARSVYKLEEIQKQFSLIKRGDRVLDVGAAPGSWTLYTQRQLLKGQGMIVAVDLKELALSALPPNVISYTGDAFSPAIREKLTSHGPYDVIISDAAPNTSGNRTVDTTRSEALVEQVLLLAKEQLKVGGNLVVKLFQGGGERELIQEMRTLFQRVKPFRPQASRSDSFEIFLVGLGRLATE